MKQTGIRTHSPRWKKVGICLFLHFLFFGCRPVPPEPLIHPVGHEAEPSLMQTAALAGTWEYHDENGIFCFRLNQDGNGRYDWQEGRFVTTDFENGQWRGKWFQTKNDPEGEFDLKMTSSGKRAEGRWWYTRIEENQSPSQPGRKVFVTPDFVFASTRSWPRIDSLSGGKTLFLSSADHCEGGSEVKVIQHEGTCSCL